MATTPITPAAITPFRVGQGFDVHELIPGGPLTLGGVEIDHTHRLKGHSDADALLHAITDALLGAAALGDIGRLFPDSDPVYAGIDSRILLRRAYESVCQAGWQAVNIDATIHAQAPKIAPHAKQMIANIAQDLGMPPDAVNIKGKTNEGLGFLGRREGIAVTAVVLIAKA